MPAFSQITRYGQRARYQCLKDAVNAPGRYHWTLLDTKTNEIVFEMYGKNPICAPEPMRNYQARLNTHDMLD